MKPQSVAHMFLEACDKFNKSNAAMVKKDGVFHNVSHDFWRARVLNVTKGLVTLGVQPKEHVAILAETSFNWTLADLGTICAGAVGVPIYPTLTGDQAAWIINNSDAIGIIVSNKHQAEKVRSIKKQCPMLRFVISIEKTGIDGVMTLEELEEKGRTSELDAQVDQRLAAIQPDDLLTLVYTSGTTGNPKGVMLSHRNLISNLEACMQISPFTKDDTHLSHLPLSHVLERMGGYYLMIHNGTTIAYAESIDTLSEDMAAVQPTVLFSVPRLFEKIYNKVITNARQSGFVKHMIFRWAMGVGRKAAPFFANDQPLTGFLAKQWALADKLVYGKIKQRTGGKLEYMIAGGAKLAPEISIMFLGMGMNIVEGYGLTETSPVLTINPPKHNKPGFVGPAVPGVEIRIAEDGEILARGPNVMLGYYKNEEATAATIKDGWIHTGDIGYMDEEGFVQVTDRKKDLIITSGGKNIAPQPLENTLKLSPFIEQAVIIGNDRKFISALIVPPWDTIETWARSFGWSTNPAELALSDEFKTFIAEQIATKMKDFAKYEQVKKFEIIPAGFTVEGGELTPSMKVKRKFVAQKYADYIEKIYAS
ncbi:AMP-dependent synthetase/ligase [Acanthopleuribacter pedis]|uniref:Long-chain fatty acid--CoA ligase n=1 Tax=Acanthopleuribacter pedis TaxID=442870 RepID=A0A8J7QCD8_9BACT|nr:long-chain fatty acid--CoA ligase [Acanthopleuribacter pedis]MBO1321882.1 long-chain fatty acid--CoA ligase [Acanthopleuribacter pedis]